jgi:hypothetical protein
MAAHSIECTGQLVAIDDTNADLLRGGFEEWLPDVPHRHPFIAALENGYAVSVCASVRISEAAHCAGVETLPGVRRKGHGLSAVSAWVDAVRAMNAIPFYSTSWNNIASWGLAARLGLRQIAVDFHIT